MYTKNIYETINNLLNMDIENYLLASNLLGIVSQRMVKKLCPSCRKKKKASTYEKKIIKAILDKDIEELYYPNGCEECFNGYIDKIPIEESIIINDELRNAIANNKKSSLIREIIYSENNSIIQNGLRKAIEGETSFEEIIRILDLNIDFTEEEKDIKDLILGKEKKSEESKEKNKSSAKVKENNEVKEDNEIEKTENQKEKEAKENLLNLAQIANLAFTEATQEKEAVSTTPKEDSKISKEDIKKEELKRQPKEQKESTSSTKEEETKVITPPPISPLSAEDNDDDDDFSYNDSYKIKF